MVGFVGHREPVLTVHHPLLQLLRVVETRLPTLVFMMYARFHYAVSGDEFSSGSRYSSRTWARS